MKNQDSTVQQLTAELERAQQAKVSLLKRLTDLIQNLPDNPHIQRFPGNPHAFVISSKHLGNNWSVEYHDSKKQYQLVAEQVEKADNPVAKLRHLVECGKLVVGSHKPQWIITMHPDVIQNLINLAGFCPAKCPSCNGEREWAEIGKTANCYFCGLSNYPCKKIEV